MYVVLRQYWSSVVAGVDTDPTGIATYAFPLDTYSTGKQVKFHHKSIMNELSITQSRVRTSRDTRLAERDGMFFL